MIVYKVKNNNVKEVECEEMRYPLRDSEGDTIYMNTHFLTKEEAYENAISGCEAGISILTSNIEDHRKALRRFESHLADECINLKKLKNEFKNIGEG